MKKILALTMASLIALNACGNIDKEKLGLTRKAPNENLVTVRPPLSLPPEYDYSPAKQAQKNMFKAPAASYAVSQPVSAKKQKAETEAAPRKYRTNAMRKSGVSVKKTGMSSAEQAFVSQVKANQQAYQKQEAEVAASAVKAVEESKTQTVKADKPDAKAEVKSESEPDIRTLAEEELKKHAAQADKKTTVVKTVKTTVTPPVQKTTNIKKTVKAKPVTSKKYSAPQYQKRNTGRRSPLRPLPKTRASSSDGMSAGEKALINHFDNQSYMSDSVN